MCLWRMAPTEPVTVPGMLSLRQRIRPPNRRHELERRPKSYNETRQTHKNEEIVEVRLESLNHILVILQRLFVGIFPVVAWLHVQREVMLTVVIRPKLTDIAKARRLALDALRRSHSRVVLRGHRLTNGLSGV